MPRGRALSSFSLSELNNWIRSQRGELAKLKKQRARAARELAAIDRRIERISGRGAAGGRARNAKSLVATLEDVLGKSGKPMQVADIVAAVEATGYRTTSDNFRAIVNQTLIKERKRFVAADRGKYQLRK